VADDVNSPTLDDEDIDAVDDGGDEGDVEAEQPLNLQVDVQTAGPCRKHVKITVPREDVDRVMSNQVQEFIDSAAVPGFRPGHVPEALVRRRYRKELGDKVKQDLLMASLSQLGESAQIEPINEPSIDIEGIELPDEGDFTYEFDVEVRPEFELPNYKGLSINRPTRSVSDADVTSHLEQYFEQYAHLVPVDEPAKAGDLVVVNLVVTHGDDTVREFPELSLRVRPTLRFHDAEITGFDKLMVGAAADDVREVDFAIAEEAEKVEMRKEQVHAKFTVLDVKRPELPERDAAFLERVGAKSEDDLRTQVKDMLERQVRYEQRKATRQQVLDQITAAADWDLPEDLVRKQVENAMRREILEMQQAGFTTRDIRAREAKLRQTSLTTTRQNLKQHFVLDRIVEAEKIEVSATDIDAEIAMMAIQSGENPRRVRSRLIKSGYIENLEAQIRERKAVDIILEHAKFKDMAMPAVADRNVEAVERSICSDIADTSVAREDEAEADDEA
jgi:trigger factor